MAGKCQIGRVVISTGDFMVMWNGCWILFVFFENSVGEVYDKCIQVWWFWKYHVNMCVSVLDVHLYLAHLRLGNPMYPNSSGGVRGGFKHEDNLTHKKSNFLQGPTF